MLWRFFSKALILLEFAIRGNFQEFQGVKKFLQKYRKNGKEKTSKAAKGIRSYLLATIQET